MTARPAVGTAKAEAGTTRQVVEPAGFDPATSVFIAQQACPAEFGAVDLHALSPFQRGLLVTDGTVTKFIEAYVLEPVEVLRLAQRELSLAAADRWLDLDRGAPVIHRRVMLRGRNTSRFFVWADSLIAAERLAPAMRGALERESGGLGRILVDTGAETRREGLWYGREHRADPPREVAAAWQGDFLTRSYRVIAGGRPLMLITERFPL